MSAPGRIHGHLNWKSKVFKQKDHKQNESSGDFVIKGNTRSYREQKWKNLVSLEEDDEEERECQLEIKNDLGEPLLFCWITPRGKRIRKVKSNHENSFEK